MDKNVGRDPHGSTSRALVEAGVNARKACFSRSSRRMDSSPCTLYSLKFADLYWGTRSRYYISSHTAPRRPQLTIPMVTDFDRCLQPGISRKGHSSTLRWRDIALWPCEDATQDDTVRSTAHRKRIINGKQAEWVFIIFGARFAQGWPVGYLLFSRTQAYTADSDQSDISWVFLCKKHRTAT